MKKSLLLIAALGLTGCASIHAVELAATAQATPQSAIVAANSFDALETVATGYLQLPACGGIVVACRNASAVATIVPAVRSGRTARNQIEALLSANNGGNIPIATLQTLQAANTTLSAVYNQFNIPQK